MLAMHDSGGELIDDDDDGWVELDALLRVFVYAGELYTVSLEFYNGGSGSCTLTAVPSQDIPGSGGSVQVNNVTGYTFTPNQSGTWEFRTSNNGSDDPQMAIFDEEINVLGSDDDGGDNYNALITVSLNAGETYHILVQFFETGVGTCTLNVTRK